MKRWLRTYPWILSAILYPMVSPMATAQTAGSYRAVVLKDEAAFSFPVPSSAEWEWSLSSTASGTREYRWEIGIVRGGKEYLLGFSRFRFPGTEPQRGALAELLRDENGAERLLWVPQSDGGYSNVAGVEFDVFSSGSNLFIYIDDSELISYLFEEQPDSVLFYSMIAARAPTERKVAVAYDDSAGFGLPRPLAGPDDGPKIGIAAPDFYLPVIAAPEDYLSSQHRLSASRSKTVILYVWSGTCSVSRGELEDVTNVVMGWNPDLFEIYGIVIDSSPDAAREFLDEIGGAKFPHLLANEEFMSAYKISGTPTVIMVDANGKLAHQSFGGKQFSPVSMLSLRLEGLDAAPLGSVWDSDSRP